MMVRRTNCTVVCSASSVTGASTPLRADLDKMVLQMAHDEWKSTVRATRVRDGGDESDGCEFVAAMMVVQRKHSRFRQTKLYPQNPRKRHSHESSLVYPDGQLHNEHDEP